MTSIKQYKLFSVDGEDYIKNIITGKVYDLCLDFDIRQLVQDMNKLYAEKECWKERATHKVLENNGISVLLEENEKLKSENKKQFYALKRMCDVEICQICENNELLFQQTPYGDEYDTRCKKGFHDPNGKFYGEEVQVCDDWELCKELYE